MKVFFISLGCDKNKVDSEKMLKLFLDKTNATVVDDKRLADVVIINTCSFIRDAKLESIEYIRDIVALKKSGVIKKILVTGCLASYYVNSCDKKFSTSIFYKDKCLEELEKLLTYVDVVLPLDKYLDGLDLVNDRVSDILSFSSFIKICDGCDKFCSYCIIPYIRGRFRSNNKNNILSEAKKLASVGVKELSIVGQDVLNYGKDMLKKSNHFKDKRPIVDLMQDLARIDGIEWLRLMYCYPEEIDDNVISMFSENKKLLPYIDMPIQHASDKILKLMNRHTSKSSIRQIVKKLRSNVKNICIRTTILVGFPGETDEDFNELKDFVKEMEFDKLGVFTYSRELQSSSYNFPMQVDTIIKEKRKKELLLVQSRIVIEKNKEKIGKVYYALVEGFDTRKKMYVVRPYFDARGIDDKVYVNSKEMLLSGTFINVYIKKVLGYDLEGEVI